MGQQNSSDSDGDDAYDEDTMNEDEYLDPLYPDGILLKTPVQPHETNHTFNGVLGDLKSQTDYPSIEILGFLVGGLLGPTKIMVCEDSWRKYFSLSYGDRQIKACQGVQDQFKEIFSAEVAGKRNLRNLTMIHLPQPIILKPKQTCGFYIHCQTNHDESLAYHSTYSTSATDLLCDDSILGITIGMAKVGPTPFGRNVWGEVGWRAERAFCGSILYRELPLNWTPETHDSFPQNFQSIVSFLFVEWETEGTLWNSLACEDLYAIVRCLKWNWFEQIKPEDNEERQKAFLRIRKRMLELRY